MTSGVHIHNSDCENLSAGTAEVNSAKLISKSLQNVTVECMDSKPGKGLVGNHMHHHRNQFHSLIPGSSPNLQGSNPQQITDEFPPFYLCSPGCKNGSDIESIFERTSPKVDDALTNRLVIVSSKVRNIASLKHALLPSVSLMQYNCDSQTLNDIESLIAQICGGQKLKSVAFILKYSGSSLQFVNKEEKVINRDGGLDKAVQEFFLHLVQNHFVNNDQQARIDFLGWCSLQYSDTVPPIVTELQTLTGVSVGVWPDLSGHPTTQKRCEELGSKFGIGELYFSLEKLRNWSGRHQQSLAGFEKIRTVGKGAYGAAVLYKKRDDESLVILKEINMHDLNASERQLALNEVNVLAMLDHPNIISYYDSFEEDGVLMIEMEYADNGTLSQFLNKQEHPLYEKDILAMFQQIVAAIRYIHSYNILHRDLKTDNTFLTKEDVVKIGDFGISKMMGSGNKGAQTVLGTPYYISPEMCEGKHYSFKSDIWALGCILYEMTCLQKTFEGSNLPAVVNKIMKGQFAPVKGNYSEEFKELISDMLKKNPDERPEANDIMYQRLPPLLIKVNGKLSDQDDELAYTENASKKEKLRSVLYYLESSTTCLTCINDLPPRMKIKHMAVGPDHVIVTTSEQQVFSWGHGGFGQLGHGDTEDRYTPTLIEHLKGKSVMSVCCGLGFSIFRSDNGLVLTCGDGSSGCLGHGDWCSTTRPRLIETLLSVDVMAMASGLNHVVVIGRDGQVLSWGDGSSGQLGLGSEEKQCLPTVVHIAESVIFKDVQCGVDGTILISDVGGVFACGSNENNKLGLNNRQGFLMAMKNIFTKTEVEGKSVPTPVRALARHRVLAVSMGAHHTAVIIENGHVITFGKNTYGQLGTQNTKPSSAPVDLKALVGKVVNRIQCGEHYTVASTKDHELYYWGLRYTVPPMARLQDQTSQPSCNESNTHNCHLELKNDVQFDSMGSKLSSAETGIQSENKEMNANIGREASDSSQSHVHCETDSQGFKPLSRVPKRSLSASSQENIKDKDKDLIRDGSVVVFHPMEIIKLKQGNEKMLLGNIYCHGENLFIQVETTAPPPRCRTFKKRVIRHKSSQPTSQVAVYGGCQIFQYAKGLDGNSCSSEASENDSLSTVPTWLKEELAQSIEDMNDGNEPDDTSDQSEEERRIGRVDSAMSSIQVNRALTPVTSKVQTFIIRDKCSPRQNNIVQSRNRTYSLNSSESNPDVKAEPFSDSSSGEVAHNRKTSKNISAPLPHAADTTMTLRQKTESAVTQHKQRGSVRGCRQVHPLTLKEKVGFRSVITDAAVKRREELLLLELERIKKRKKLADIRIRVLEKEREAHNALLKQEAEKVVKEREKALLAEVEKLHLEIEMQHVLLEDQQKIVGKLQDQLNQVIEEQANLRNVSIPRKPGGSVDESVSSSQPTPRADSSVFMSSKKSSSKICVMQ